MDLRVLPSSGIGATVASGRLVLTTRLTTGLTTSLTRLTTGLTTVLTICLFEHEVQTLHFVPRHVRSSKLIWVPNYLCMETLVLYIF